AREDAPWRGSRWSGGPNGSSPPAIQSQPVAALAVAEPVRDPRHRRRRGARLPRHLVVRQPLVQQLRCLPAMRHRLDLGERAQIPEEALRLLARPKAEDRLEEIGCLARSPAPRTIWPRSRTRAARE